MQLVGALECTGRENETGEFSGRPGGWRSRDQAGRERRTLALCGVGVL